MAVELQEEASVAELKEVVGSQQGVRPDNLRVLFAGRELQSTATLQVSTGHWSTTLSAGCSGGGGYWMEESHLLLFYPPLLFSGL